LGPLDLGLRYLISVFEHGSGWRHEGGRIFGPDGRGHFEILNSGSSDTIGFWTGRQHATVTLPDRNAPIDRVG
jgi:hypothetical protein